MTGSAKANVKLHNSHGNFTKQDTSHLNHVSLIESHYLMECDNETCKWRGWVVKSLIDQTPNS
jgi:hypothetical protein